MSANCQRVDVAEAARQTAVLLPSRDAMSLFNLANITAINISLALNAGTLSSSALSDANLLVHGVQH
jgi:hypothetical protein